MARVRLAWLPVLALALLLVVCLLQGEDLLQAVRRVDLWVFAAALALHGVVVVVRTEAWRVTLAATGTAPPVRVAHRASAVGFAAGILQGHATLPARMAVARKLAPAATPSLREMLLSDLPVYALEACLLAALVPLAAAGGLGLPRWATALIVVAAPAAVLGLRLAHRRWGHHPVSAGLAVLARPGLRGRLFVLAVAVVGITFGRIWLILWAVGLPAGVADASAAYIAVSLVGQLPIGPATGPAATLAVAAGSGVAEATAAGLVISATSVGAVLVYLGLTARASA